MKAVYDALYYDLTLKTVGIGIAVLLIVVHLLVLLRGEPAKAWLKALPRNERLGMAVLAFDFAWCFLVWSEMDLGEFFTIKKTVQMVMVFGFFGFGYYVREFLAVRAIGLLLILLACPVLNAAFLQPPATRLLLVFLAYAWIIKGMFYVGMPYLMRDGIDWVVAEPSRWRMGALAGLGYGVVLLLCAVMFY